MKSKWFKLALLAFGLMPGMAWADLGDGWMIGVSITAGASESGNTGELTRIVKFQAGKTGVLKKIYWWQNENSPAPSNPIKFCIYEGTTYTPTNLLRSSSEINMWYGWVSATVSDLDITAGITYWLGWKIPDHANELYYVYYCSYPARSFLYGNTADYDAAFDNPFTNETNNYSCVGVIWGEGETYTPTPTDTPTNTPTWTPTETPTESPTDTPTWTPTESPTDTASPTETASPTATPTPSSHWYSETFDSTASPPDWVEKADTYSNMTFTVHGTYPGMGLFYRTGGVSAGSSMYRLDKTGASALGDYIFEYTIKNDWGTSPNLYWLVRYNDTAASRIEVFAAYGGGPYRTYSRLFGGSAGGSTTTHTAYTTDGVIKTLVYGADSNITIKSYFNDGLCNDNTLDSSDLNTGSIGFKKPGEAWGSSMFIDDMEIDEITPTSTPTVTPTHTPTTTPTVSPTCTPSDFGDISSRAPISYGYHGSSTTTFWGQYVSKLYALASATGDTPTVNVDWNNGNVQYVTLAHDYTATISLSGGVAGGRYALVLAQDGTGGHEVSTTISGVKWADGITPTFTTTASKKDILVFLYDGTDYLGAAEVNY